MRIESNANFSVTLSKQGTHYHLLYCQHLNKSSSSAFRPALPTLWLRLVLYLFLGFKVVYPGRNALHVHPDLGSISSRSVGVRLFILLVWDKERNPDQTLIRYGLSILEYPTIRHRALGAQNQSNFFPAAFAARLEGNK